MDNFETTPVDEPIYIIDHQHKPYKVTLVILNGKKCRREYIEGVPEYFYRNALIAWAYYYVKDTLNHYQIII